MRAKTVGWAALGRAHATELSGAPTAESGNVRTAGATAGRIAWEARPTPESGPETTAAATGNEQPCER